MPGFSKDLNSRYNKKWEMKGAGIGNLANKRHSVVIPDPKKKCKKRKKSIKGSHSKN